MKCARKGCPKPCKPGRRFCCAKCASGWRQQGFKRHGHTTPVQAPPTESWWIGGDFYVKARERFPADAPTKSHIPVHTYGDPRPGYHARAGQWRRDQRRSA